MKRFPPVWLLVSLAVLGVVAFAAGCGSKQVDQSDEVADAQHFIHTTLTALPPTKSVKCDSGVDFKAGTKFNCTATLASGQTVTIPLVVKSVSGNNAKLGNDPDVVDQALAVNVIYHGATTPVKSVDCPSDVPLKVGNTFTCKATFTNGDVNVATIKILPGQGLVVTGVKKA